MTGSRRQIAKWEGEVSSNIFLEVTSRSRPTTLSEEDDMVEGYEDE